MRSVVGDPTSRVVEGGIVDDQVAVKEAAIAAVQGFLGGPRPTGDAWTFDLGEHLASNWGAVYGGATAAAVVALLAARKQA